MNVNAIMPLRRGLNRTVFMYKGLFWKTSKYVHDLQIDDETSIDFLTLSPKELIFNELQFIDKNVSKIIEHAVC